MATIAIANEERLHGTIVVTWETLDSGDEGKPYQPPVGYDLEGMQFIGTFSGGTAKVQGSNQTGATNFADLEATGVSAVGIIKPDEQALFFRPALSGGTSEDVDVIALFRARH